MDNLVKELRTAAGLRQEDLARPRRREPADDHLHRERRYNPSLELAWKLSRALGTTMRTCSALRRGTDGRRDTKYTKR